MAFISPSPLAPTLGTPETLTLKTESTGAGDTIEIDEIRIIKN